MPTPLSPDEIALFQALVKSAVVLLLMLRLDRPAGARELADLLGLDEHTVAKYLRILTKLNLVARSSYQGGYLPIGGRQFLFGEAETVKKLQPTHSTEPISEINKNQAVAGGEVEFTNLPARHAIRATASPVYEALRQAGVGEPKRSQLCAQSHLTPEDVRLWESQLKKDKGGRYSVGLLIHVLESGDPPSPANEYDHILGCSCDDCQRLKYRVCPDCASYPCQCPD